MSLLDITLCTIIVLIGINLGKLYGGFSPKERKWLLLLFLFHLCITLVFNFYVSANGGDAVKYWNLPKAHSFQEIWGLVVNRRASSFIYFMNYVPSHTLDLSFFTGNLLYSTFGFLGFVYLFKMCKELFPNTEKLYGLRFFGIPLFPWIFFLPNLHFWSSGIGKDAILFFCCITFFYAFLKLRKRYGLLLFGILLSVLIRPHITVFLLSALTLAYVFDGRLKNYQKLIFISAFIAALAFMSEYLLTFIQIENFKISTIENFANNRASSLSASRTESNIDVSSYPYALKVFTFLYRPLFFDIVGILAVLASFENLILILFTFLILRNKPLASFRKSHFSIKAMPLFFLLGTLAFSLILGNLGIMLRQKNMFFPLFLLFGLYVLYQNKTLLKGESINPK
ncbi:MAG: hypothetical protein R2793_04920 [Flavobacteriaceae bacterium]